MSIFPRALTSAFPQGGEPPPSNTSTLNERLTTKDEVLTVGEVAKRLRCSKAHVYKAINGNVSGLPPLPAIFLGRRRLIRQSTLEHWMQTNERAAGDAMLIASLNDHAVDA